MQTRRICLCAVLPLVAQYAFAQHASQATLSDNCVKFSQTVFHQVDAGHLAEAEAALSDALASPANGLGQPCAWMLLHNMANVMERSGRFAQAEVFAEQAVKTLERSYPHDDPALLHPLQLLAAVRFEQGKISRARDAYRKLLSIRMERAEDRSLLHSMGAQLLEAESRHDEAAAEYLKCLKELQESGRKEPAGIAGVLNMLGGLYLMQGRLEDAGRTLDRAINMFAAATDIGPIDRVKLLNTRALLYVRQNQWRKAEEDLRDAIATADGETRLDSVPLERLLASYAYVLRRNHKGKQAFSVEARAAALHTRGLDHAVVDASKLRAGPKSFGGGGK